jgi:hypothetical protein
MNMNFDPNGVQIAAAVHHSRKAKASVGRSARTSIFRYAVWSSVALAGGYLIAHAGTAVLWGIGGTIIGLFVLATAVCIYAQNNTRI